ncbi:MAG: PAS domain S-box protein [Azonexaceae bacterium]|nr:PAS domain S-box protein [Azonexaceae bacterium]
MIPDSSPSGLADTPPAGQSHRLRWLLALPKLGIVLLVIALISLLVLLHRSETEEQRTTLIKDVLWLEQSLRFHLNGNQEQLQQLALELPEGGGEKLFRLRATHMLKNSPEIAQILWLDAHGHIVDALPTEQMPDTGGGPSARQISARAMELADKLSKPVYSETFTPPGKGAFVEVLVPIRHQRKPAGVLIAVYPLASLLSTQIPWWFTEKYRVEIVNDENTLVATQTAITGDSGQMYQIPFDPPGYGLVLRVTSYATPDNTLPRILIAAIILLAIGVFWSLWLIRDLMRKRSRAEEALRSEHAFRAAMEDSLTVGMRARDLKGKIIYVNPAFCKMTGFAATDLVGTTPPMPYWAPENLAESYAMHEAVMAGEAPPEGFEMTFMRKSGERFQALVYEAKLIDGHGEHTGWMASVLDITERKEAEEMARQQQEQLQFTARLVTLGEMASTLAHELNQPLAAIASYNTGCLNLLADGRASNSELQPALEKIGLQAQRAGKIVRRVYDFVRRSEPKRAPCDLRGVIEDCVGFVETDARRRQIRIETSLPALPPVPADRLMLEQVLLNLIRNAMDSMGDTPEHDRLLGIAACIEGNEVRISVSDRGCGISPEISDKLYTAFFTTKPEGMGVGLSICRSIIEFHRGRLWAEDNFETGSPRGTIFLFTLPLEST